MKNECNFAMKKLLFGLEVRNNEGNPQKRVNCIVKWSQIDVGFSKNCILIDGSWL
jgi:hypothetical protein